MFCPNCGTQLPDGSRFCNNCGTQIGAAPTGGPAPAQGYQQPQSYQSANPQGAYGYDNSSNSTYGSDVYGANTYTEAGKAQGTGEIPARKYAWTLAAMILIELAIAVPLYVILEDEDSISSILGTIIMVATIGLLLQDSKEIKRCGYTISKVWYILGFFFIGPYLFHRAKVVDQNYKPFWLWLISVVLMLLAFFAILSLIT